MVVGLLIPDHLRAPEEEQYPSTVHPADGVLKKLTAAEDTRQAIEQANGTPVIDLISDLRLHLSFIFNYEDELTEEQRKQYDDLEFFYSRSDIYLHLQLCEEAIYALKSHNSGHPRDEVDKLHSNFLLLCARKKQMDPEQCERYEIIKRFLALHGPLPWNA